MTFSLEQKYQEEIYSLKQEITLLQEQLSKALHEIESLKVKKDSSNSSMPPSSDFGKPKRNQSTREKSDRKSGGQKGHEGHGLKQVGNPDEMIDLKPKFCKDCGKELVGEFSLKEKRQVVDIPKPKVYTTEYRQYSTKCTCCGLYQQSPFPNGINSKIQYGANVEAIISYLSVCQYISHKRISESMKDLFGLPISQGTVDSKLSSMTDKSKAIYDQIRDEIEKSKKPVGSDETSCKVNGKKEWAWISQTEDYCHIRVTDNRKYESIEESFPKGFPNAVLVSDRYAAQLKTLAKAHQICHVHLQRDLKYLVDSERHDFSKELKQLFKDAMQLKREFAAFAPDDSRVLVLEKRLDELLEIQMNDKIYPKTVTLQKSMIKLRNSIFTFLYDKDVPYDNNASERGIRNFKVKMKVSSMFKTGQNRFAILRSIVETAKKRSLHIFNVFACISKGEPILVAE